MRCLPGALTFEAMRWCLRKGFDIMVSKGYVLACKRIIHPLEARSWRTSPLSVERRTVAEAIPPKRSPTCSNINAKVPQDKRSLFYLESVSKAWTTLIPELENLVWER
jgi:hypothetical protein